MRMRSLGMLAALVLMYAASFHYVYYIYLSDMFDYAYYKYLERSFVEYVLAYLFCLIPVAFRSNKESLSLFAFDLIYLLVYIPGQLMLIFMWRLEMIDYYVTSILFLLSMLIMSMPTHIFILNEKSIVYPGAAFRAFVYFLTIFGLILLFYSYGSTMRFVGFDEVYALRTEANETSKGALVDYTVIWLTFISLPYFFSVALCRKSMTCFFVGVVISLSLYAAQGAKIAILNIFIILSLYMVLKVRGGFLAKALFASTIVFVLIATVLPDDGVWLWTKSIFMVRIYGNAGWMMVTYSEFFAENGYTFFSHIGLINKFFDYYPYGNLSPGQLIGLNYMGTSEANFNANFLASDGIAGIGAVGLPIISFCFAIFISLMSYFSKNLNPLFLLLFSSGFFMSLLNVPLSTAIFSGGGGVILALFYVNSILDKKIRSKNGES